jgi:hypothetical protein
VLTHPEEPANSDHNGRTIDYRPQPAVPNKTKPGETIIDWL